MRIIKHNNEKINFMNNTTSQDTEQFYEPVKAILTTASGKSSICINTNTKMFNGNYDDCESKHVHIVSDSKIRVGDLITGIEKDWGIWNEIHQVKAIRKCNDGGDLLWFNDECNGISAIPEQCRKIIVTSDSELIEKYNIARVSTEFLEHYMKSYNDKSIIQLFVLLEEYAYELGCDPAYYGLPDLRVFVNDKKIATIKINKMRSILC